MSFNPRTREGCDLFLAAWRATSSRFQSTHPRGVRLGVVASMLMRDSRFNPRTREGCDTFTHAGQGARPGFNPRTREGCDISVFSTIITTHCFNPRTREGCDIQRG